MLARKIQEGNQKTMELLTTGQSSVCNIGSNAISKPGLTLGDLINKNNIV
jgi:hypothetical protein